MVQVIDRDDDDIELGSQEAITEELNFSISDAFAFSTPARPPSARRAALVQRPSYEDPGSDDSEAEYDPSMSIVENSMLLDGLVVESSDSEDDTGGDDDNDMTAEQGLLAAPVPHNRGESKLDAAYITDIQSCLGNRRNGAAAPVVAPQVPGGLPEGMFPLLYS